MYGTPKIYGYTYKGVTYKGEWMQEDEEVCKMYHNCYLTNGKQVDMDWSSYSYPSKEEFEVWVDLGMPTRITNGPLCRKDLLNLIQSKNYS